MKLNLNTYGPLALVAICAGVPLYGHPESRSPLLRIVIWNAAHLDAQTVADAAAEAARIFEHAGVRLVWASCNADLRQTVTNGKCVAEPHTLWVRIVAQPTGGQDSGNAMGYASTGTEYVTVFRNRVLRVTQRGGRWSESVLLGHVIAHELGHLLLGTAAHASSGLMAGTWNAESRERAARGYLWFSAKDSARIRCEVLRYAGLQ